MNGLDAVEAIAIDLGLSLIHICQSLKTIINPWYQGITIKLERRTDGKTVLKSMTIYKSKHKYCK